MRWIVLVALVLASCQPVPEVEGPSATERIDAVTEPSPEPSPEREPPDREPAQTGPDAGARAACRHFRNVAGDIQRGLLTEDEAREKLREVHSTALISEEPGVAEHAEGLFAAVTQRDAEALTMHADGLSEACTAAGL